MLASFRNGALAGFLAWQVAALQAILLNQLGSSPVAVVAASLLPGLICALAGGLLGALAACVLPRHRALAAPAPAVLLLLAALARSLWSGHFAARQDLVLAPTVQAFALGLVSVGLLVLFLVLGRGAVLATLLAAGLAVAAGALLARPHAGSPVAPEEARSQPDPSVSPAPALVLVVQGLREEMLDRMLEADRERPVAARRLPNLGALLQGGCRARLAPFRPSGGPVFWTTLATGCRWTEHGIHGESFRQLPLLGPLDLGGTLAEGLPELLGRLVPRLAPAPPQPPAPEDRRRPALWEVLARSRHAPLVIGWPLIGADREVPGAWILDEAAFASPGPPQTVVPVQLGSLSLSDLVATLASPARRHAYEQEADAFLAEDQTAPVPETLRDAAREALIRFQARTEFAAITLEELALAPARTPVLVLHEDLLAAARPSPGSPLEQALLELLDRTLGNLLVRLEGEVRVLLVAPALRPGASGLVVASGGPFRPSLQPPVRLEDLAPTLLHSLGLPAADDATGRPIAAWFDASYLRDHPLRVVPSWQVEPERP